MTKKESKAIDKKQTKAAKTKAAKAVSAKKAKAPAKPKHPLMINKQSWDKEAVMNVILNSIASSSKSISSILKAGFEGNTLPDYATICRWLSDDSELCDKYARAKEAQADFMAEELAELHEKAWVPVLDENGDPILLADGSPLMIVDKSSAAIVRLEAENKKWLMGKLKPKKYSDKQTLEHTGANGAPLVVQSSVTFVKPSDTQEDEE